MKIKLLSAAVAVLALSACKQEAVETKPEAVTTLDTLEQKVSYIIGYNTAKQLDMGGFDVDSSIVKSAMDDVTNGVEAKLTDEEMRATMMTFQTTMQERAQEQRTKALEENLQKGEAFLAENGKREGVVTTESGLQYEVITEGTGEKPSPTDRVSVNYKGTLIDGEQFDANDGVEFVVNQLIPGWVEALPMMPVGSKWKLFIPANLAYGAGGSGKIGPNSALIFEMELLSIVDASAAEEAHHHAPGMPKGHDGHGH